MLKTIMLRSGIASSSFCGAERFRHIRTERDMHFFCREALRAAELLRKGVCFHQDAVKKTLSHLLSPPNFPSA